jgi:hypothetical protein
MAALDLEEPQVLLFYEGNRVPWHHRLLLRRLREAVWVVASPDFEIQVENLADHRLLALARGGAVPQAVVGQCYLFEPIAEAQLSELHAAAGRTAAILGAAAPAPGDPGPGRAAWRVADPSAARFGDVVGDDVVSNGVTGVIRGSVGLARVADRWVFVERVPHAEVDLWEADKRCGAGRDRRLAGDRRGPGGRRFVPLSEALATFRAADHSKDGDWPFEGPCAVTELLEGIRNLGRELFTFHDLWLQGSGLHGESAVAWEHKCLLTMLGHLVSYDQLDPGWIAGAEFAARRVLMLERAARVNPRNPNFTGLHMMIQHSLEEGGGVATRAFTEHMARLAESEARILKQNRLLREETALKAKEKDVAKGEEGAEAGAAPKRRGKNG